MSFRTILGHSLHGIIAIAGLVLLLAIFQSCRDMGGPAYMSESDPAFEAPPEPAIEVVQQAPVTPADESLVEVQITV